MVGWAVTKDKREKKKRKIIQGKKRKEGDERGGRVEKGSIK